MAWELWLAAGLLLCGAELLHPGVFLLWVGTAAILAGLWTAALHLTLPTQIGTFGALALFLVSIAGWRQRRHPPIDRVNAPDTGLIGASCTALTFTHTEGRVAFRDGTWAARSTGPTTPLPGTNLVVTGLDGTVLLVAEA